MFSKTWVPFLVETTKIENISFPFKTAMSETNIKTYRMESTKTIGVFPVTSFFGKTCSSFRISKIINLI